ncbi:MAG: M56 family metallopeptidase, partial [Sphingobacteriaceae bacterium]
MEANQFILALSKTLPQSCVQSFTIYLLLQLLFWVDKKSTPLIKFNLYYAANWLLFIGFLFTFFHYFQQVLPNRFTADLTSVTIKNIAAGTSIKPNLWLSYRFWLAHYTFFITGFYLLGLLFCLFKFVISIFKVEQFRNPRNLKLDDKLTQTCFQLKHNFGLIKTVSVYLSVKISVPLTIGSIRPIIVFPVALINQLSTAQTEAILLHELAHIKRHDYLLNLLLCIVQAFLFFNPAVWLMQREISKYREQSCDDLVLNQTQNQLAYAHALLLIEQYRSQSLNLTLASNGKKHTLLNRIQRITSRRTNETSPKSKLVVLLFALVTIGFLVTCNLPEKKAVKSYKSKRLSFTVYHSKTTGFDPKRPYAEWSADTVNFIRKSEHDSLKVYTNKLVFKPNKKYSKKYTIYGDRLIINEFSDKLIQAKNRYKILIEDSTKNKNEYSSIADLPAEDQKELLNQTEKPNKLLDVS